MFLNPVLQVFMSFVGLYMSYTSQVESHVIFSVLFMLGVLIDETLMCPTWIKEEFVISLKQEKETPKKKLKRYRYCQNRKSHQVKLKKFCRQALPYHLVLHCHRRRGNKPCMLNVPMPLSLFKRHLSNIIRNKSRSEKQFRRNCHNYVTSVFNFAHQKRTLKLLDPIHDIGGVPKDLYVPFLNLHNLLLANTPMQDYSYSKNNKYSKFETDVKMNSKHNLKIASYFRVNEFSANPM